MFRQFVLALTVGIWQNCHDEHEVVEQVTRRSYLTWRQAAPTVEWVENGVCVGVMATRLSVITYSCCFLWFCRRGSVVVPKVLEMAVPADSVYSEKGPNI